MFTYCLIAKHNSASLIMIFLSLIICILLSHKILSVQFPRDMIIARKSVIEHNNVISVSVSISGFIKFGGTDIICGYSIHLHALLVRIPRVCILRSRDHESKWIWS
uniref:Uncharacterized protein n=1 Tax=Populus davidiana TaxID=266767 RepID=A0A6M2F084_9ROSI